MTTKTNAEISASLTCPYIDKQMAKINGTAYYCTFDNMEFESMPAHCSGCEMYAYVLKKAEQLIFSKI